MRLAADQIFYDLDTIPIGVNFQTYIENAVSSCGIMLVIIGKPGRMLQVKTGNAVSMTQEISYVLR